MEEKIVLWTSFTSFMEKIVSIIIDSILKSGKGEREEYNNLRGEVAAALIKYGRFYHNPITDLKNPPAPIEEYNSASDELKSVAAKVAAYAIKTQGKSKKKVERRKQLDEAQKSLIGLSNNMFETEECIFYHVRGVNRREETIRKSLELQ